MHDRDDRENQSKVHFSQLKDELELKQRNVLYPDTARNSATVDDLLLNGSNRLTLVQRIGTAICGLSLIIIAIAMASIGRHSIPFAMVAFGLLYLGARILMNSIPKAEKKHR